MGGHELNAIFAAILLAFGVTMPLPEFAGGMIVALGCCFAVMAVRPIERRKGLLLTLLMGAVAGLFAAMLHEKSAGVWIWGSLPLQAQMGAAGALSQALFEFVASRGAALLDKAANTAGLPGAGGDGR